MSYLGTVRYYIAAASLVAATAGGLTLFKNAAVRHHLPPDLKPRVESVMRLEDNLKDSCDDFLREQYKNDIASAMRDLRVREAVNYHKRMNDLGGLLLLFSIPGLLFGIDTRNRRRR